MVINNHYNITKLLSNNHCLMKTFLFERTNKTLIEFLYTEAFKFNNLLLTIKSSNTNSLVLKIALN